MRKRTFGLVLALLMLPFTVSGGVSRSGQLELFLAPNDACAAGFDWCIPKTFWVCRNYSGIYEFDQCDWAVPGCL